MFAPWAALLVELLVECVVKSTLLIAVVGAVLWALRVTDANIRHRTWTVVLLTMLALPALGWMLPAIEVPGWLSLPNSEIAPIEETHLPIGASVPTVPGQMSPQVTHSLPAAAGPTAASTLPVTEGRAARVKSPVVVEPSAVPVDEPSVSWQTVVAAVYLAVAAVLFVRLGVGMALTWRMVRRGQPLSHKDHCAFGDHGAFERGLRIVESADVCTPATVGMWRPVILLPSDWRSWSDSAIELAIAHERSHVRRRDTLTTLLANGNVAAYWFHPLAWGLRRKLADLAEQVCDDEVLRTHGDRACYAETLLTMASRLVGQERVSPLLVPMARQAQVESRIEAVIDARRPLCRRLGWQGLAMLLAIAVPLVTSIAALQPAGTAVAEEDEASPSASRQRERPENTASATGQHSEENAEGAAPGGIIAGHVVSDADGSAIRGAEVRLTGWNENRNHYDQKTVVSDDQGEFRFDELPEGNLQVIALKENLASRTERYHGLKVKPGDEALELRMKPVPALRVKVVDKATQKPLAGAMVRLTWTDGVRDHTAGDNGEVLIRGLTPELWTIEVFADGYAEREEAIQLNGTETTTVTAALEPGFALEGVVVDEEQQPLAGVGISVFPRDSSGGQIEYLTTDTAGKYRFGHLPLAGLQLNLSKNSFADQRIEVAPQVEAGKTQRLDVTLSPRRDGGFVMGTVIDSEGRAVAGAKVINVGRSSRDLRETTTDAEGRFRLNEAFQGVEGYMLVVKSTGHAPGIAAFSPGTREEPTKIEVVLKPGHRLRGRVVDEQGKPLAGIYVGYDGTVGFGEMGDGGYVVTEADGRFQFDSLPGGIRFDIRSYNTAGQFSALHEHKLPLDRDEEVVVTLPAEGVIRGRVMDAVTDKPLPTFVARVTFSPDRTNDDPSGSLFGPRATGEGETFSSPQGEFRMGSFTQGMPLQVTIEADGYERAVMRRVIARRESEAEPVEFRLQPIEQSELLTFAGQVVDQAGQGIGGVELRLIVSRERRAIPRNEFPFNWQMVRMGQLRDAAQVKQFLTETSDPTGWFTFKNVLAGPDIEIAYWGSGVSQDRLRSLERIDEAGRQNLRIEITSTGTVMGKFDRKRFPEVDDVVLSGNGDFFYGRLNANDKTYRIENVPPGNYELQLYRQVLVPGKRFRETEVLHREWVEVKSGETKVVDMGATKEEKAERGETTNGTNSTNPSSRQRERP
jgi:beta-lactamase regulating signal transducer with metallopeptidase domain